jgi:starvation-inducible DNA-binding protein
VVVADAAALAAGDTHIETETTDQGASMSITSVNAPDTARLTAASWLRRLVPEVVALTRDAKQAHWNVTGPAFLPIHELTDDITTDAQNWTDRVAERALALGFTVDARGGTVARTAGEFPVGYLTDRAVIGELTMSLGRAAGTARRSLADLEATDAVGHDTAMEVLEALEKYRSMVQAHKA